MRYKKRAKKSRVETIISLCDNIIMIMRNRLLEDFSEKQILEAAKVYLKKKLNWDEEPIEYAIDSDSILLVYENQGELHVEDFVKDNGVKFIFAKGRQKRYRWIEFEKYDGLRPYITLNIFSK